MRDINRRDFLRRIGLGTIWVGGGFTLPRFFIDSAQAQTAPIQRVLHIFMNGGCDLFSIFRDDSTGAIVDTFKKIRPTLWAPRLDNLNVEMPRRALANSKYTVHNRMGDIHTMYASGEVAFLHKFGVPLRNSGSHDIAQRHIRTGIPDGRLQEKAGWMQRVAQAYFSKSEEVLDITGGSEATLGGTFRPLALTSFANYGFNANVTAESGFRLSTAFSVLSQVQGTALEDDFHNTWSQVEGSVQKVQTAVSATTLNPAFPATSLGTQLSNVFRAFTNFPTRLAYCEFGGFDLHGDLDPQNQTQATPRGQSSRMKELNDAIAAFRANCVRAGIWDNTLIIVNSEFGRTNKENGTFGADHGSGGLGICIGKPVRGGIYGSDVTVDELMHSRNSIVAEISATDAYSEILTGMGLNPAPIIPAGYQPKPIGFIRT